MILMQLKAILRTAKMSSLKQLAIQLNSEPDIVRDMLSHWMRKGYVKRCSQPAGCATHCTKCDPLLTETYEWIEPRDAVDVSTMA